MANDILFGNLFNPFLAKLEYLRLCFLIHWLTVLVRQLFSTHFILSKYSNDAHFQHFKLKSDLILFFYYLLLLPIHFRQQPGLDVRQLPKSMAASHPQAPRKKRVTIAEEYRHENSHFMMTKPTYRRHFIIAPDWVSERTSHRRLQQQGWARKSRLGSQGVGY